MLVISLGQSGDCSEAHTKCLNTYLAPTQLHTEYCADIFATDILPVTQATRVAG